MGRIPDEVIEQVKDAADLLEIVGESVELKKTGSDYRGACPFHGGKHRNFAVIPRKGIFYCYVCHEGGDVFSYMMKRFGLDYPSAVREVARRVGVTIPEATAPAGPDPREPLFGAAAAAQEWFATQLRESAEAGGAREYLQSRDWPMEVAVTLGLGYAPRQGLVEAMAELGIEEQTLLKAGLLVARDDGSVHQRFRGRLIFPIRDLRGRVVAFGGRILGPGEPKYLNSPETEIFHKGRQLYHLETAKNAIRKAGAAVLVEGFFDVLRLAHVGIENVVAPLGTALTEDQAALLKRYAPVAVMLYDSDAAGLRATFRAADVMLRHELEVRVATLPPGEDPDSLAQREGAKGIKGLLDDAVDVLERKIQMLQNRGWFEDMTRRRQALDRLMPTMRSARNPITRELYLDRVAEVTGIGKEVLAAQSVERQRAAPSRDGGPGPTRSGPRERRIRDGETAERAVLRVMLSSPVWIERAREQVKPEWFERQVYRQLFELLVAEDGEKLLSEPPDGAEPLVQRAWAYFRQLQHEFNPETADQVFGDSCRRLEARPHFREYEDLRRQIKAAEPDDLERLVTAKDQKRQLLRERYPEEFRRRSWLGSVG